MMMNLTMMMPMMMICAKLSARSTTLGDDDSLIPDESVLLMLQWRIFGGALRERGKEETLLLKIKGTFSYASWSIRLASLMSPCFIHRVFVLCIMVDGLFLFCGWLFSNF
jgi:hypothetical protein